jgi:dTDP-4-amino-4,6-dideoxygalactose transaminase
MTIADHSNSGDRATRLDVAAEPGTFTVDLKSGAEIQITRPLPTVPFVDIHAEHRAYQDEIDEALLGVVRRGDFILGEAVERFETAFAGYSDAAFAVGIDSGYAAIELMLRSFRVGRGDEVITAANTFVATVGAIEASGAKPVLVDVDPDTYNIDPARVEAAVTPATRAIIAVHLYGHPADMGPLREIADSHGIYLLEDAAQAHGALYRGRKAGSLGDAAAFSFYPSKNLGAFGDGGMVTTSDEQVAERLRLLRNLGSRQKYLHEIRGFNHRLDTIHAAVLGVKLQHLDEANSSRRRAAALYEQLLPGSVVTPAESGDARHVYHLYVVQVPDRARLIDWLDRRAIAAGIHYPVPVHLQPAYRDLGYEQGAFPVSEHLASRIVSLPMYSRISPAAVAQVAEAVEAFFGR